MTHRNGSVECFVSFFLDPPVLFILGMLLYHVGRRFRWGQRATLLIGVMVSIPIFIGGSYLLYTDVLNWPLPLTQGSSFMFHTGITGIAKADVDITLVALMFLLYPVWHFLGYLLALYRDVGSFVLRIVSYEDVKSRREIPKAIFVVRRSPSPRQVTREAVEALGGIGEYVKEGDKVLIKPNICGGNPDIPGSFTSIEVVDELVKMIREAGAEPLVADADMIWTKFEPVAEAQGWTAWARDAGVPLVNLSRTERVRFNFGGGSSTLTVPVSRKMVEADVIVSVPVMKTHILTSVTMGMKNMYGTFTEENKAKYHRFGIEGVICDVNRAFTPNLTVIDGTVGGDAWGPLSCTPVGFQTVVASNDVVAADAIACQLMGYDPMDIVHIKMAHEEGLGDASVSFDPRDLPYSHPKDGEWEKPDPRVSVFYGELVESLLLVPGMQALFDAASDFVLYGAATHPLTKKITPRVEGFFNNFLSALLSMGYRGSRWTEEDLKKFQELLKKGFARRIEEEETPA
jgi:uncharacterized protein (DUF362 family)